nr:hypothetical protein [Tanacetum cinerariifolium]
MVRDDNGKGKLNDDKGKVKRIIKDDLEERIDNAEAVLFKLRDIRLMCMKIRTKRTNEEESKPLDVPMHTEEEEPNPFNVPMQTEEEYPIPLDVPIGSCGQETIQFASLVKVTNVVLGLRAPKQKLDVLVLAERETFNLAHNLAGYTRLDYLMFRMGYKVIDLMFRKCICSLCHNLA